MKRQHVSRSQERGFCFFKQKTAYEIDCDWSSDVCSSDLNAYEHQILAIWRPTRRRIARAASQLLCLTVTGRDHPDGSVVSISLLIHRDFHERHARTVDRKSVV